MISYNFLKKFRDENAEKEFPYEDTGKIKRDFQNQNLEDLNGDLNTYYMEIFGTVSRILDGSLNSLNEDEIEWFRKSFFENFPNYSFLQKELSKYPTISTEMEQYEKARRNILLLKRKSKTNK